MSSATVPSASRTNTVPPQTITVEVGKADHKFRPNVVLADIGDTIEFTFYPQNHSVVRAEYKRPCIPIEHSNPSQQGFFSGFHAVDAILANPPTYSIRINDTSPIFFYCSAPASCIKYGMVGVINPNTSVSLTTHREFALNSSYMLQPGESFPSEISVVSSAASSSDSKSTSSNPNNTAPVGNKLSGGGIAGIIIACVSVILLATILFVFWGKIKRLKKELNRKNSTIMRRTEPQSPVFYPWSEAPHLPPPPPVHAGDYPLVPLRNPSRKERGNVGLGFSVSGRKQEGGGESFLQSRNAEAYTTNPYNTSYQDNKHITDGNVNDDSGNSSSRPRSPPPLQQLPHRKQLPPFNLFPPSPLPHQNPMTPPPSYFPHFSNNPTTNNTTTNSVTPSSFPQPPDQKQAHNTNNNQQQPTRSPSTHSSHNHHHHHRSVGGIFDVSPQTGAYTRVSSLTQVPHKESSHARENEDENGKENETGRERQDSATNTTTTTSTWSPWTPRSTASSPFHYEYVYLKGQGSGDGVRDDDGGEESGLTSSPPAANVQTVSPTYMFPPGSGGGGDSGSPRRERDLRKVVVENRARGVMK
ncbi:hypothetical protein DM02DRAFT_692266 [Periconia macrospinosa]|uniref:Cupredoxin n=1 Tax=Periconia macrospinosa TaxID=97972 RepID=A0A2V1E1Q1_9PLEO|nr:hypothetical protein DM02DRAFT_692266 [Periconia macrospinosa]